MKPRFGPFELDTPFAQGAMGVVWRGVHLSSGIPVAVKVLTGERVRQPSFIDIFRGEVRAIATLDHPGVVTVLDFGQMPLQVEAATSGQIPAGSPYIVMELIEGVQLRRVIGRMPWRGIRHTLLGLLDALAHAHARGVIHRDLKPANILLAGRQRMIKLTDFGVAHAMERDGRLQGDEAMAGTPNYMAPEQVQKDWRDYGAWTDLYGVGCVAWTMATGSPPFAAPSVAETLSGHLSGELGRMVPLTPVADGFEAWIRRLLTREPRHRFRRAADAAFGLLALAEQVAGEPEPTASVPLPADPTVLTLHYLEAGEPDLQKALNARMRPVTPVVVPPVPRRWQRDDPPVASVRLPGVGLSLFGLRRVPLIGREQERDTLWSHFRAVWTRSAARVAVLRGATGCGKTRLAEWLVERAHEVGAATVLSATHAPVRGPTHGLRPMVSRFMRLQGLDADEVLERAQRILRSLGVNDADAHLAMARLLTHDSGEHRLRLTAPGERYAIIWRLVANVASERPVVLWLDDAEWGADALEFANYILDVQDQVAAPVLVLVAVAEDRLEERPNEARILSELTARPDVSAVSVAPLSDDATTQLLRSLVGLDESLLESLAPRLAGQPLFALQLLGYWIEQHMMVPGPTGYRLASHATVPPTLADLWQMKIDAVCVDRPQDDRLAIELAAALGHAGETDELDSVCEHCGVTPSPGLVDVLMAHGLARPVDPDHPRRWAFAHRSLGEVVVSLAQRAGRLEAHHRACAEVLERDAPHQSDRIGHHRLAAGDHALALQPLLDGARDRTRWGQERLAQDLIEQRENALSVLGVPKNDPRWADGWEVWIRAAIVRGDFDIATERLQSFAKTARKYGWTRQLAVALVMFGDLMHRRGDNSNAARWLGEAITLGQKLQDLGVQGRARRNLARAVLALGEAERAFELARQGREDLETQGDELEAARCLLVESFIARVRPGLADPMTLLSEALRRFETLGYLRGMADSHNQLGELARARGRLALAERRYRDALALFRATGSTETLICELNLILTQIARGRYEAARPAIQRALATVTRQQRIHLMAAVRCVQLPVEAASNRWIAFDEALQTAARLLAQTGFVDVDVARVTREAANLCEAAGEYDRAAVVGRLALAQFRALKDQQESAHMEARLEDWEAASRR